MTPSQFIEYYKYDVIKATEGTGLLPSVKMAQMIIESGWGRGITATQANNFFGIKADPGWTGPKKAFNTPNDGQKVNYFRVYPSALESIRDHSAFLQKNSRYARAGVFSATTPEDQVRSLAYAGYAEAKDYEAKLINLIDTYNLRDLDGLATYKAFQAFKNNRIFFVAAAALIAAAAIAFYLSDKSSR